MESSVWKQMIKWMNSELGGITMRIRHALASLGLVVALLCGWSATASVLSSDAMASAMAVRGGLHSRPLTVRVMDESGAQHHDDNGDDISAPQLLGLAVEIESPRELEEPPRQSVGTTHWFS